MRNLQEHKRPQSRLKGHPVAGAISRIRRLRLASALPSGIGQEGIPVAASLAPMPATVCRTPRCI